MKRPSRGITIALVGVTIVVAIILLVWLPVLLHPGLSAIELSGVPDSSQRLTLQQTQAQLQDQTRASLLQGMGGLLLIGGALATWRQVQLNQHGQITERLTHAVEQLAGTSMDVRIGGIYALHRVAKNSAEDREAVTAILTAFIRTHAPHPLPRGTGHQHQALTLDDRPPADLVYDS